MNCWLLIGQATNDCTAWSRPCLQGAPQTTANMLQKESFLMNDLTFKCGWCSPCFFSCPSKAPKRSGNVCSPLTRSGVQLDVDMDASCHGNWISVETLCTKGAPHQLCAKSMCCTVSSHDPSGGEVLSVRACKN